MLHFVEQFISHDSRFTLFPLIVFISKKISTESITNI